jgi:hypothetical protein
MKCCMNPASQHTIWLSQRPVTQKPRPIAVSTSLIYQLIYKTPAISSVCYVSSAAVARSSSSIQGLLR